MWEPFEQLFLLRPREYYISTAVGFGKAGVIGGAVAAIGTDAVVDVDGVFYF